MTSNLVNGKLFDLLAPVPGLAVLWYVNAQLMSEFTQLPNVKATPALAVIPALVFYWLSQSFETIFTRWYGWGEREGTRLDMAQTALLPSGRDLNDARQRAINTLPGESSSRYPGENIYRRAKKHVQQKAKETWASLALLIALNKLCRGLAMESLIVSVVGAGYLIAVWLMSGVSGELIAGLSYPAAAAMIAGGIVAAGALFLGFVWLKWTHMFELYDAVRDS